MEAIATTGGVGGTIQAGELVWFCSYCAKPHSECSHGDQRNEHPLFRAVCTGQVVEDDPYDED